MPITLKKVRDQVIVITGASSGIGLATAQLAADRGARVVLSSRDETDLGDAADQIRAQGGQAISVAADVADFAAMQRLADAAVAQFGRIDTWINNAGVSIYGRLEDVAIQDARRLFETNYWGVVNGTLAALPHLKRQGGALINVGSVLSDTGYPLQGHYTASKHAVKGFTDSLRLELKGEKAPVSVTLIQPAAIDTPYPEHAKSYLGVQPKHQPPVYAPEVVARAVLACTEHPERDVLVGGGAVMFATMEKLAPRLGDRFKELTSFAAQHSDVPAGPDTLYAPRPGDAAIRGHHPGHVMESSAYTAMRLNRGRTFLALAALGLGIAIATNRPFALRRRHG